MTVLILSNPTKKQSCEFAKLLYRELTEVGIKAALTPHELTEDPSLAVVAGGDGTILRYLDTVLEKSVPVLGINFGHRGYLTGCKPEDAKIRIMEILGGNIPYQKRMLYDCEIARKDGTVREYFTGLNEAVLSRGSICRAIDFNVYINGSSVLTFPADGIIVATPTGSTAYNFSAQGPILMPDSDSLVVTPICASSLLRSSLVVSGSDVIELTIDNNNTYEQEIPTLIADGFRKIPVDFNDRIIIRRSEKTLKLYGGEKSDFLRVLQQKMT